MINNNMMLGQSIIELRKRRSRRHDENRNAICIHKRAKTPQGQAQELLDWILELLKSTLCKGEEIVGTGFGRLRAAVRMLATDGIRGQEARL